MFILLVDCDGGAWDQRDDESLSLCFVYVFSFVCLQVASPQLPKLDNYEIISKFSCLQTKPRTNDPIVRGKHFKLVHFIRIELPSKHSYVVPEDELARANPEYYHKASCKNWRVEISWDRFGGISALAEALRALGVGGPMLCLMKIKWDESYFAKDLYPPCPCGEKLSVGERKEIGWLGFPYSVNPHVSLAALSRNRGTGALFRAVPYVGRG